MMRYARTAAMLLCVSLIGLTGCEDDLGAAGPTPQAKTTGAPIGNGASASTAVGGFRVTVPASSVSGPGTLTATENSALPTAAAGLKRIGSGVHVDLGGAGLKGLATVSFAVPPQWDKNLIPIIAWQDGRGGWRWLPTSWKPGQTTATAQTDHFSDGFLGGLDVGAQAREAVKQLGTWFTGRSGVAQPTCAGQDAARAKLKISSGSGDSVKWCLGTEAGKTVLKIANNRITYTEISYPKTWKVIAGQRFGVSLDALAEFAATTAATALGGPGRETILVQGGKTVEFSLPADSDAKVIAQISFYSWALQALGLALDIETKIAKLAGIELKNNGLDRLIRIVTNPGKLDEWGKAGQDCLKSYTEQFTSDLTKPVELGDTALKIFNFAGTCAIAMGAVSASESGPLIFPASVLLEAVSAVVSTIVSAVQLLVSITREIWDSIASFGGGGNPVYIIRFTPRSTPTIVVKIDPLNDAGAAKPEYAVEAVDSLLECSPYVYPSPSAVSGNIYACGSTASNTDVCWIEPGADHAFCDVAPWDKTLRRFTLNEWPVAQVKPLRDPRPWGLVLADGTRCLRRIGGSWSGRPDGWVGSYSCDAKPFVVLADPENEYKDIDKSRPTWIVRVGELSDNTKTLPAPRPMAVKTAYYASRG
ncbi:hypothetical protein EV652_10388 [Kribbella steppae]|uniref:Uncharacterized protein n=1 Tax=Kribbella steppae TaxID=2512223 RepID=A0A4R2HQ47_9ACTN|nr:hypothetical protein EV652_10388 [Kribbella steppae]